MNREELIDRADDLKAIYVVLCLSNDDDPRKQAAMAKAKEAYDDICEKLNEVK